MKRTSTSKAVGSSRISTTVKNAAITSTKRKAKAKKWSKDKARQKQKELDDQVGVVYDAIQPKNNVPPLPNLPQDYTPAVNALEESLRGL